MKYEVLSNPSRVYKRMLSDIRSAKEEILLETYIYGSDVVGREFCDELTKKALEGVRVKILIDAWGSNVRKKFFKKLIDAGGKVRFFREFRYVIHFFNANHERNHRKLLVIDGHLSYVGSINITHSCLDWEELVLRIEGSLAKALRLSFRRSWKRFNIWKIARMRKIFHKDVEIIQDFPSERYSPTEKNYRRLIKKARKEILIKTPYFIPSRGMRKAFRKVLARGVKIKMIIPKVSDSRLSDIFRERYLGKLNKMGFEIYHFPRIMHSKLLIVDDNFFLLGSSNLDYRSFKHQYEINILGKSNVIVGSLKKIFYKNLRKSKVFNYILWKNRGIFKRLIERLVKPFREYF
ncbi:MAG: hypothetical protein KKF50_03290 [Nanoarchaeota archaeon]|nr:hypothetical protein [Nanoarchaeota archaeon]